MSDDKWSNGNNTEKFNNQNTKSEPNRQMSEIEKLRMLESQRETPEVTRDFTPGGTLERETHTQLSNDREAKIKEIKQSLRKSREDQRDNNNQNCTERE